MEALEELTEEEQRKFLSSLTLNNIVKAGLVSLFPTFLDKLGFDEVKNQEIWSYAQQEMGITSGDYPFYNPLDLKTFQEISFEGHDLGKIIRETIKNKYVEVGTLLAFLEDKINMNFNHGKESYYVFVSNELDLLKALAEIQSSIGEPINIPVLDGKIPIDDERRKTHLIKGTQGFFFYRRLLGDMSFTETVYEKHLRSSPFDGVIAVTPKAGNNEIPIRIHRRKSPQSLGEKYASSDLAYLLSLSYEAVSAFQRKSLPETRIMKYDSHKETGAKDIAGMGVLYNGYPLFVNTLSTAGLSSLVEERDSVGDHIESTGARHWDLNLTEYAMHISPNAGRVEVQGYEDATHYIRTHLLGPYSHGNYKKTKLRELEEIHPIRSKRTEVTRAYEFIENVVVNVFMPGIELARYPDSFIFDSPFQECQIPSFKSLERIEDFSEFEGKFSLYNTFPYREI